MRRNFWIMNKRVFIYISVGVVVVLLLVGIRFASKAHNNLVTLNVRDADIKEVLREIQWQTFEIIYKNKDVNGKITLDVKDLPLENVLQIVAEQSSSRFNVVYPLYSNSESLLRLKKLLRGEIPIEKAGWTNYSARQLPLGGPMFLSQQANLQQVSLTITGKDADLAALALSRYEPSRVILEDGVVAKVNLIVSQVPFIKAVERLAKQIALKWTALYTLQPRMEMGRRFARGSQDGGNTNQPSRQFFGGGAFAGMNRGQFDGSSATNTTDQQSNAMVLVREEFQRQFERQMEVLSPQERQQMEEMRQRFEQIRQLPPEERRAQFEQIANDPEFRQRMEQRILNRMYTSIKDLTPEQRAERERDMRQMRQRFGRPPG